MSRFTYRACLLIASALFVAAAGLGESTAVAQDKQKFVTPKIVTVDGVRLNAAFYPSAKKNAPAVIMLHPVGIDEGIHKPGWKTLAEKLQESYSVIMFDFRGHGESKTLDEPSEFWKIPTNVRCVRRTTKEADTIDVKDYIKAGSVYLPALINDIAAVKTFLDKRNDSGECNSANTIVIGAESGATLGAIWINAQWNCFKYTVPPPVFGRVQLPIVDKRAEGNDIVAAVWLNLQPTLATRTISMSIVLKNSCTDHAMPTAFFYGAEDTKAKEYTKAVLKRIKPEGSKKHEYIVPVEPKTNLSGVKLLQKSLQTTGTIVEYLDTVLVEKKNEWEAREFSNLAFGFRNPRTRQFLPAKRKDQKMLQFDTYENFINQ